MSDRPTLVVIAGPNGSGKTTLSEMFLKKDYFEAEAWINPDVIANERFGGWDDKDAILKAANFAEALRQQRLSEHRHIVFETVLSVPDKLVFLKKAKAEGYFVHLIFIGTERPAINASRVMDRMECGGHSVPIEKIRSRYFKSIANGVIAARFCDVSHIFDNSKEGAGPSLAVKMVNGNIVYQAADAPVWTRVFSGLGGDMDASSVAQIEYLTSIFQSP